MKRLALFVIASLTLFGCSTTTETTPQPGPPGSSPSGTEPPYNVIATPLSHLTDGQVVHASGHTFVAGESIAVLQCAHEVLTDGAKGCDLSTAVTTIVDEHGAFETSFTVHRKITIGDDHKVIDCGERDARCNISGSAVSDVKRAAGTGINFDDPSKDPPGSTPSGTGPPGTR